MHADQVDLDVATVAGLVASQFPQWRDRPIRPVFSHGTVNALYRLGDDLVLRFPLQLRPDNRAALVAEQDNARRIAAHLPVAVPEPVAIGEPGGGYAGPWAVHTWIEGEIASEASTGETFARDLARVVRSLQAIGADGRSWDGESRGGPLAELDVHVRYWLAESGGMVDIARVEQRWARCLDAPVHDGDDVWIHADLMPGNLIVRDGRLAAVIDLGELCVGDPAVDLMPAWNLLSAGGRAAYRDALDVDNATWERGCGWALAQSIGALAYYAETNPVMSETARRTLTSLLA